MIGKPKKPHQLPNYTRSLLAIVDEYNADENDKEPDLYQVAKWAHAKGLMDLPEVDPHRVMARNLARACRQDYVIDENGEPVRKRHAVREESGDIQRTLWPNMEDIVQATMRASLNSRRKGFAEDVLQIERDRRSFNKNYNPIDPIEIDYNFNKDVEEHFMPTDYPDEPPADHSDDS